MKELLLPADVVVYMQKAASFPDGVMKAHEILHEKATPELRAFYGISHPGRDGQIMYWAAATELYTGELAGKDLQPFTIIKGRYIYKDLVNFMQHSTAIGNTFMELLKDSRIAPDGCCIEHYYNETDCRCMVRIK